MILVNFWGSVLLEVNSRASRTLTCSKGNLYRIKLVSVFLKLLWKNFLTWTIMIWLIKRFLSLSNNWKIKHTCPHRVYFRPPIEFCNLNDTFINHPNMCFSYLSWSIFYIKKRVKFMMLFANISSSNSSWVILSL